MPLAADALCDSDFLPRTMTALPSKKKGPWLCLFPNIFLGKLIPSFFLLFFSPSEYTVPGPGITCAYAVCLSHCNGNHLLNMEEEHSLYHSTHVLDHHPLSPDHLG